MSENFWEPLPGWWILRWAVWVVLAYMGVMLIYGTFFRNAQPWLLDVLAGIGLLAILGGIGLLVAYRHHRRQPARIYPPPER